MVIIPRVNLSHHNKGGGGDKDLPTFLMNTNVTICSAVCIPPHPAHRDQVLLALQNVFEKANVPLRISPENAMKDNL